jgi:hypothetical protein
VTRTPIKDAREKIMQATEFMAMLDGAKVVRFDVAQGDLFVWSGGHGVHGYMPQEGGEWSEVLFFNCGDFGQNDASERDVMHSITGHMQMDEEEFWSFC